MSPGLTLPAIPSFLKFGIESPRSCRMGHSCTYANSYLSGFPPFGIQEGMLADLSSGIGGHWEEDSLTFHAFFSPRCSVIRSDSCSSYLLETRTLDREQVAKFFPPVSFQCPCLPFFPDTLSKRGPLVLHLSPNIVGGSQCRRTFSRYSLLHLLLKLSVVEVKKYPTSSSPCFSFPPLCS